MAYTRQPNVVIAGTALKQNPPASTLTPPGIVPVILDADIATTTSLGVVQVGYGLSITPAGILSANHHADDRLINVKLVGEDYEATLEDYYIGATRRGITITFPKGELGKVYVVKNQGDGSVTVRGTEQNLDESRDKTLGSESSLIAVFDGTRWNLV